MIDLDRVIRSAIKSRKIFFGSKRTIDAARSGKATVILTSSNCPNGIRRDIQYLANLSGIPLYTYKGSSLDLSLACGKNFPISALTIREIEDPELLRMLDEQGSDAEKNLEQDEHIKVT